MQCTAVNSEHCMAFHGVASLPAELGILLLAYCFNIGHFNLSIHVRNSLAFSKTKLSKYMVFSFQSSLTLPIFIAKFPSGRLNNFWVMSVRNRPFFRSNTTFPFYSILNSLVKSRSPGKIIFCLSPLLPQFSWLSHPNALFMSPPNTPGLVWPSQRKNISVALSPRFGIL